MTTVVDSQVREKRSLQPVTAGGWRRGLGNLLRKEIGEWFGTKRWFVHLLIWIFLLNFVSTMVILTARSEGVPAADQAAQVTQTLLEMMVMTVGIGLVISAQGEIVGEKQLGTAAWVMSKPAARAAFVVAKVVANAVGFGLTAVTIPAIIFMVETRLVFSLPVALGPFLAGLGVVALALLFYLMLTLMLGTIYNSRGPIAGIGIGLLLAGLLVKSLLPEAVLMVTPWLLTDVAVGLALQMPLPDSWFVPLIANTAWIVLFTAVALWRFGREEF